MRPLLRRARMSRLALSATAATVALAVAAPAAPGATGDVADGQLDWSSANVYVSGGARTWLGYVTTLANGTATASGDATGTQVTPASPKGDTVLNTFQFPLTGGTYDSAKHVGTINASGTVTFASQQYGFAISIANPVLKLNGTTGTLSASGQGPTAPYTADQPLFNLDLANATFSETGVGTQTIEGIVPSLATVGTAFPQNYQVGAGPDRTPNTFGSFSLTVQSGIQGKIAAQKKRKVVITSSELSALSSRRYAVTLSTASSSKRIAKGTISGGRKVTLTLDKGAKRLKAGEYRIWTARNAPPIYISLS